MDDKTILSYLNSDPLNLNLNLFEFGDRDGNGLFQLFVQIMGIISPDEISQVLTLTGSSRAQRLYETLELIEFPMIQDPELLPNIQKVNRDTFREIIAWTASNARMIPQMLYDNKFLGAPRIPTSFRQATGIPEIIEQLLAAQDELRTLIAREEEIKDLYKDPQQLNREINALEDEVDLLTTQVNAKKKEMDKMSVPEPFITQASLLTAAKQKHIKTLTSKTTQIAKYEDAQKRLTRAQELRSNLPTSVPSADEAISSLEKEIMSMENRLNVEFPEQREKLEKKLQGISQPINEELINELKKKFLTLKGIKKILDQDESIKQLNQASDECDVKIAKSNSKMVKYREAKMLLLMELEKFAGSDSQMSPEELQKRLLKLKQGKQEGREKNAKLKYLSADVKILTDTLAVIKTAVPNAAKILEAANLSLGGMFATAAQLEDASKKKADADKKKSDVLAEHSAIVEEINRQVKIKKEELKPKTQQLSKLRAELNELKEKLKKRHKVYSTVMTKGDSGQEVEEAKKKINTSLDLERKYHYTNAKMFIDSLNIIEMEHEIECENQVATIAGTHSRVDYLKNKLESEEEQFHELKTLNSDLNHSTEPNMIQMRYFETANDLIKAKLDVVNKEEIALAEEERAGGFDRLVVMQQ
eukprot:TRINITY_DN3276_c2_g3_i1.p1 TRINITY_DN3276_c2_g3~~TRINITY_DN3276_c2_g3_i1.p1  ORF type:complete len:646 (+),score=211.42 TRINITY_DN3276_c2_g3_i1:35-1972(+)